MRFMRFRPVENRVDAVHSGSLRLFSFTFRCGLQADAEIDARLVMRMEGADVLETGELVKASPEGILWDAPQDIEPTVVLAPCAEVGVKGATFDLCAILDNAPL